MGGTREGGLKAAAKLKATDPEYFKKLRAKVKRPTGGKHAANGFDADPERARSAGAEGGRKSRRRKAEHDQETTDLHSAARQTEDQSDSGSDRRTSRGARQNDQPTARGGKG